MVRRLKPQLVFQVKVEIENDKITRSKSRKVKAWPGLLSSAIKPLKIVVW